MGILAEIDQDRRKDLKRYVKILPECDRFDDRIFFLCGIINLYKQLEDLPWRHGKKKLYNRLIEERLAQGYSQSDIERACCVPRGQLGNGYYERTIIGCLHGFK